MALEPLFTKQCIIKEEIKYKHCVIRQNNKTYKNLQYLVDSTSYKNVKDKNIQLTKILHKIGLFHTLFSLLISSRERGQHLTHCHTIDIWRKRRKDKNIIATIREKDSQI